MVVHRYRDNFLGIILSYDIIVELCLNLVRRRQVIDVKDCLLLLFLWLFLLELLPVWNAAVPLQIRNVDKADIGKPLLAILGTVLVKIKVCIVQHSLIIKLADRIHRLVHAVRAHRDMIGQLEHLTRLALRPSAYKAHILVLAFLLFLAFTVCRLFILFYFILSPSMYVMMSPFWIPAFSAAVSSSTLVTNTPSGISYRAVASSITSVPATPRNARS